MRIRVTLTALALAAVTALSAGPALAETEWDGSVDVVSGGAGTTAPTTPTSAELAAVSIQHCSGYIYATGINNNSLTTEINACGAYLGSYYSGGVLLHKWAPVIRAKCYRYGVQFGDGTGGCRWRGSLSHYHNGSHKWTHLWARPGSASGSYWDDSGRVYGGSFAVPTGTDLKFCADSWGYLYGGLGASGNSIVHFVGATGTDYGTFNMASRCSPTFDAHG